MYLRVASLPIVRRFGVGLATCGFVAALAGCGAPSAAKPAGNAPGGVKVGIVFDSGGIGDKSFNDTAWAGITRAEKELGCVSSKVESRNEKDYEGNLTALADKGMNLVVAVGMNMRTALEKVAPEYPDVKFAIVDAQVQAPNVRSLRFNEHEGSFLAGYLAGLMTKTGKIGFVGGMDMDLIRKFQYGYFAGARMANPKVELLPAKYVGSWDNVDLAKASAAYLFGQGADIVYHAAGRAGMGVIRAAKEANAFAIGVDSDQDYIAPGHVLTSMVKRVDVAVFQTIQDVKNEAFTPGDKVYDLKAGGVGISDLKYTKDLIGADKLKKVDSIRQQIVDGKIKAPSTEAEFGAFRG